MLNDLNSNEIQSLITKYGQPRHLHFSADFLDFECDLVKRSAEKGRYHDITCFIQKDGRFVVIQKHDYAETRIFRAPSGGVHQGESIEEAAIREMYEETGMKVRLLKFVLDVTLEVICKDRIIPWRSLVFLSEAIGGIMKEIDTYEIYTVRLMSREELLTTVNELMENSGWGGFKYRAFLTREFFNALDNDI